MFVEGELPALLGGLECKGNETDIFDCPRAWSGDLTSACDRFSDAGVVCQSKYL